MNTILRYANFLMIVMAIWGNLHNKHGDSAIGEELLERAVATLGTNWLRHAESVKWPSSPNGNYLASGGSDRYLRIWDLKGRRLHHELSGETNYGHKSVAFSPDGTKVAALTGDGNLRVWDLAKGLLSWERELHKDSSAFQVKFFSDGQRIASSGNEGIVIVSDVESGETAISISCDSMNANSRGLAFAISPDDSTIALGSWCDIEIVPVDAPDARTTIAGGHGAEISSLCFAPDGTRLLSCGASIKVDTAGGQRVTSYSAERKLWSLIDNRLVRSYQAEMPDLGTGNGRVSSDGRVIATNYGSIEIWDLESGDTLRSFRNLNRRAEWFKNGFDVSPDNQFVAAVDGTAVLLWDTRTGKRILDDNPAHNGTVTDVAYSKDGRWIASSSREGDIRIWDRKTSSLAHAMKPTGNSAIQIDTVAFSPDSERVLAAGGAARETGFAGTLSLWNTVEGKSIKTKLLDGRVTCVHFSISGKQAIVGTGISGVFGRGRAETAPRIYTYDEGLNQQYKSSESIGGKVIAIQDGKESDEIYFVEDSKKLWHWKTESNALTQTPLDASQNQLISAAFSRDGSIVATSGLFDEKIYLWETANGTQLAKFVYQNSKGAKLAFSPDGRLLAIAPIGLTRTKTQYAKNVVFWDTQNDANICELQVSMSNVSAVEFSPDGLELLTGHEDGTLTVWRVP